MSFLPRRVWLTLYPGQSRGSYEIAQQMPGDSDLSSAQTSFPALSLFLCLMNISTWVSGYCFFSLLSRTEVIFPSMLTAQLLPSLFQPVIAWFTGDIRVLTNSSFSPFFHMLPPTKPCLLFLLTACPLIPPFSFPPLAFVTPCLNWQELLFASNESTQLPDFYFKTKLNTPHVTPVCWDAFHNTEEVSTALLAHKEISNWFFPVPFG